MPINDSIENRTFEDLFSGLVNFEVPFFQRNYSWGREQWKTLLEDIWEQIIADVIEQIKFENPNDLITREQLSKHLIEHEHYFGAIVVLEKMNTHPALKSFLIIDGQQRITTAYLLLAIVSDLLKEQENLSANAQSVLQKLDSCLRNNVDPKGDDYRRLKIISNKGDRLPTYLKLNKQNPESPSLVVDNQLYTPGKNQIDALWDYAYKKLKSYNVPQLCVFAEAILNGLKIVWIPLDEHKDNPQAIFEGLNDKGMPLSAVELLCSYKNTLGNLCLIGERANSSLGNDPFERKRGSYTDVSALCRDIKSRHGTWNISAIKQRSGDLSKKALEIWSW